MSDIFGRMEQVYGGGLTSDASWMFWGGLPSGGLGMLVTQSSIQYQQPIRRIYEIGPWTAGATSNNAVLTGNVHAIVGGGGAGNSSTSPIYAQPVYFVAGRPEGQMQLARIAGPVPAISQFYRKYGNICSNLNTLLFMSSSGCIGGLPGGVDRFSAHNTAVFGKTDAAGYHRGSAIGQHPYLGWYLSGVVLTQIGLQTQAQELLTTENLQCMFVSLRLFTAAGGADLSVGIGGGVWTEV